MDLIRQIIVVKHSSMEYIQSIFRCDYSLQYIRASMFDVIDTWRESYGRYSKKSDFCASSRILYPVDKKTMLKGFSFMVNK